MMLTVNNDPVSLRPKVILRRREDRRIVAMFADATRNGVDIDGHLCENISEQARRFKESLTHVVVVCPQMELKRWEGKQQTRA